MADVRLSLNQDRPAQATRPHHVSALALVLHLLLNALTTDPPVPDTTARNEQAAIRRPPRSRAEELRLATAIRTGIARGTHPPGAGLGRAALACYHGSASAVARALETLRADGLVEARRNTFEVLLPSFPASGPRHGSAQARMEQVLRQQITRGDYPAESFLPTLATLAHTFGVGTTTARRALQPLILEGLVEMRRRRPLVRPPTDHQPGRPGSAAHQPDTA